MVNISGMAETLYLLIFMLIALYILYKVFGLGEIGSLLFQLWELMVIYVFIAWLVLILFFPVLIPAILVLYVVHRLMARLDRYVSSKIAEKGNSKQARRLKARNQEIINLNTIHNKERALRIEGYKRHIRAKRSLGS